MPKPKWTYSFYRATLYKNEVRFAIATPDGRHALSVEQVDELLELLNRKSSAKKGQRK